MVRRRVRGPAREGRRTDYCPHTGWHDSRVVIKHVSQWNYCKFTERCQRPEAMVAKRKRLKLGKPAKWGRNPHIHRRLCILQWVLVLASPRLWLCILQWVLVLACTFVTLLYVLASAYVSHGLGYNVFLCQPDNSQSQYVAMCLMLYPWML